MLKCAILQWETHVVSLTLASEDGLPLTLSIQMQLPVKIERSMDPRVWLTCPFNRPPHSKGKGGSLEVVLPGLLLCRDDSAVK